MCHLCGTEVRARFARRPHGDLVVRRMQASLFPQFAQRVTRFRLLRHGENRVGAEQLVARAMLVLRRRLCFPCFEHLPPKADAMLVPSYV